MVWKRQRTSSHQKGRNKLMCTERIPDYGVEAEAAESVALEEGEDADDCSEDCSADNVSFTSSASMKWCVTISFARSVSRFCMIVYFTRNDQSNKGNSPTSSVTHEITLVREQNKLDVKYQKGGTMPGKRATKSFVDRRRPP